MRPENLQTLPQRKEKKCLKTISVSRSGRTNQRGRDSKHRTQNNGWIDLSPRGCRGTRPSTRRRDVLERICHRVGAVGAGRASRVRHEAAGAPVAAAPVAYEEGLRRRRRWRREEEGAAGGRGRRAHGPVSNQRDGGARGGCGWRREGLGRSARVWIEAGGRTGSMMKLPTASTRVSRRFR